MLYFQIIGLQAVVSYFEVLGINSISELTTSNGEPPHSNPQVFIGVMHFTLEPVSTRFYNSITSHSNSPPSSIPALASTSVMTKS